MRSSDQSVTREFLDDDTKPAGAEEAAKSHNDESSGRIRYRRVRSHWYSEDIIEIKGL